MIQKIVENKVRYLIFFQSPTCFQQLILALRYFTKNEKTLSFLLFHLNSVGKNFKQDFGLPTNRSQLVKIILSL